MGVNDQIIIYQTADGQTQIDVRMENETIWLSANQMAVLFDRDEKNIRKHVNNIFSDCEVDKESNTHFCVLLILISLWLSIHLMSLSQLAIVSKANEAFNSANGLTRYSKTTL